MDTSNAAKAAQLYIEAAEKLNVAELDDHFVAIEVLVHPDGADVRLRRIDDPSTPRNF